MNIRVTEQEKTIFDRKISLLLTPTDILLRHNPPILSGITRRSEMHAQKKGSTVNVLPVRYIHEGLFDKVSRLSFKADDVTRIEMTHMRTEKMMILFFPPALTRSDLSWSFIKINYLLPTKGS